MILYDVEFNQKSKIPVWTVMFRYVNISFGVRSNSFFLCDLDEIDEIEDGLYNVLVLII